MWRCLVFVVAVSKWILVLEAVPQGENTCQGVVKHPVKVKVNVTEPVTFRTYTWCLRVPPRCSKFIVQMRERVKEQIEMHNRTITVCCRGFVEMESKCVPACPPMTECPNMHCNRTNHCYCSPGYSGVFCNDPCPKGSWGKDCKKPCDCPDGFTCHHLTGDCMLDDKPSVKTTVRRAFTHISSESAPTTIRSASVIAEHQSTSKPVLKTSTASTISPNLPTTNNYLIVNGPKLSESNENTSPPFDMKHFSSTTNKLSTASTHEFITTSTASTTAKEPKTSTFAAITLPTTVKPLSHYTSLVPNKNNVEVTSQSVSDTSKFTTVPDIITTTTTSTVKPTTYEAPSTTKPMIPYWRELTTVPFIVSSTDLFSNSKDFNYIPQDAISVENSPSPDLIAIPIGDVNQRHASSKPFSILLHDSIKGSTPSKQFTEENVFLNNRVSIGESSSVSPTVTSIVNQSPTSLLPVLPQNIPDFISTYLSNKVNKKPNTLEDFEQQLKYSISEASTTFPTPYSSDLPKLHDILKIPSLNTGEGPLDFTTVASFHHLNILPVTNAPDRHIVPMQTPNRNWDLFIPSPGSTKSQSSLTIPFSPYIPITSVKFDDSTTELPKGLDSESSHSSNNFGENLEEKIKSFTEAEPKTSVAHIFLHSFSDTIDMDVASLEVPSSSPSTVHISHSVSRKKPYFIGGDFGLLSRITNKKENVQSTTPFLLKLTNNFPEQDNVKSKVEKLDGSGENIYEESEESTFYPTTQFRPLPDGEATNKLFDELNSDVTLPYNKLSTEEGGLHKTFLKSYLPSEDEQIQITTQTGSRLKNIENSVTLTEMDDFSKPVLFHSKTFDPPTNTKSVSVEPSLVESVNILSKNDFTSFLKPKTKLSEVNLADTSASVTIGAEKETPDESSTVSHIISSTYYFFNKTVTSSDVSAKSPTNLLDDNEAYIKNRPGKIQIPIREGKVSVTTQLPARDVHSSVNGNILEELSNYLPTNNDKSSHSINFKLENKIPTQEYHATPPELSGYLPTDKNFLNLTYILNSINDFTSNSKRGMKQSKSSMFENPIKMIQSETSSFIDFLANSAREPSTEVIKPVSVFPTQKNQKQENTRMRSHHHKEKNNLGDSRIIHLNVTIPLPFLNPTTKYVQNASLKQNFSTEPREHAKNTLPIDGRITTVSIISTSPVVKYQVKRSTKEYFEKTENAFKHVTPETFNSEPMVDSFEKSQETPLHRSSRVTPSYVDWVSTLSITPQSQNEEVSKKPFRRKETDLLLDRLENMRLNMTAALAAPSAPQVDSISYLPTSIIATLSCILIVGFLISSFIFAFIYCKKEKPVPMESCIMAYEQPSNPDPSAIYSVPRPSLLPDVFFCPTFSHHYAAQINKELRELSYGGIKKENSEPVYTEISTEITRA